LNTPFESIKTLKADNVVRQIIPNVNDTFSEKSLPAADSTVFLEQFVSMYVPLLMHHPVQITRTKEDYNLNHNPATPQLLIYFWN